MAFTITPNVEWVGKTDWELRKFHGEQYSTQKGSTYNSYLIRDEHCALIDTVYQPCAKEFVEALKSRIDLKKIDFIIANHGEIDHSGALPELMKYIPDTPIYCTAQGQHSLQGHYHQNWNFKTVKTGDRLHLGQRDLIFFEAPMLHWPDSMFCYLTGEEILFSNDAFGQHFCSEFRYNDEVDSCELNSEALKYYANILNPFSQFVQSKITELSALKWPIKMICPSHGIIWRTRPEQIIQQYLKWADSYQEDQITLIYDTMWNSTRKIAEAIAQGLLITSPRTTVKLFNVARADRTEILAEVFKSKMILVGSPTINNGILSPIAGILEEIKGLKFKNKKAAAFGAYGWNGLGIDLIENRLKEAGLEIISEGLRLSWMPDAEALARSVEFGKQLVSRSLTA